MTDASIDSIIVRLLSLAASAPEPLATDLKNVASDLARALSGPPPTAAAKAETRAVSVTQPVRQSRHVE